ncbi:MAG TPA: MauE/DoxX family redox-associated membrane protein [Terracidiphilus sp.]|nr:MauE/DoxX family redox-associated membrane protein [Terracidiphilus sp.]
MKRFSFITDVFAMAVGFIFLAASWHKLVFPYEFLSGVYAYEIVGPGLGAYVVVFLPWIELIVGLSLLVGLFPQGALAIASGCCFAFVFVQASALSRGLSISCGCFGGTPSPVTYATLLRTVFLLCGSVGCLVVAIRKAHRCAEVAGQER